MKLPMTRSIELTYSDLSFTALVKIFELADRLDVTPREAAQRYLVYLAQNRAEQKGAA